MSFPRVMPHIVLRGDAGAAKSMIPAGKQLMLRTLLLADRTQGVASLSQDVPGKGTMFAKVIRGQQILELVGERAGEGASHGASQGSRETDRVVWWAEGFVITPKRTDGQGWGLPKRDAAGNPVSDPRGTVGGPCGEVLINRYPFNNYPDVQFAGQPWEIAPPFWMPGDAPSIVSPSYTASSRMEPDGAWVAHWSQEARYEDPFRKAIFDGTNALRAQAGLPPYCGPIRGEYNQLAQQIVRQVRLSGVMAHDSEKFEEGYRETTSRMWYRAGGSMTAENVGASSNLDGGLAGGQEMISAWRDSPGHYANIVLNWESLVDRPDSGVRHHIGNAVVSGKVIAPSAGTSLDGPVMVAAQNFVFDWNWLYAGTAHWHGNAGSLSWLGSHPSSTSGYFPAFSFENVVMYKGRRILTPDGSGVVCAGIRDTGDGLELRAICFESEGGVRKVFQLIGPLHDFSEQAVRVGEISLPGITEPETGIRAASHSFCCSYNASGTAAIVGVARVRGWLDFFDWAKAERGIEWHLATSGGIAMLYEEPSCEFEATGATHRLIGGDPAGYVVATATMTWSARVAATWDGDALHFATVSAEVDQLVASVAREEDGALDNLPDDWVEMFEEHGDDLVVGASRVYRHTLTFSDGSTLELTEPAEQLGGAVKNPRAEGSAMLVFVALDARSKNLSTWVRYVNADEPPGGGIYGGACVGTLHVGGEVALDASNAPIVETIPQYQIHMDRMSGALLSTPVFATPSQAKGTWKASTFHLPGAFYTSATSWSAIAATYQPTPAVFPGAQYADLQYRGERIRALALDRYSNVFPLDPPYNVAGPHAMRWMDSTLDLPALLGGDPGDYSTDFFPMAIA